MAQFLYSLNIQVVAGNGSTIINKSAIPYDKEPKVPEAGSVMRFKYGAGPELSVRVSDSWITYHMDTNDNVHCITMLRAQEV